MVQLNKQKRPGREERPPRHTKFKGAGPGGSSKTRPDVPSTPENKASTGKQVRPKHGGRGKE
jgi:hypothetical protein